MKMNKTLLTAALMATMMGNNHKPAQAMKSEVKEEEGMEMSLLDRYHACKERIRLGSFDEEDLNAIQNILSKKEYKDSKPNFSLQKLMESMEKSLPVVSLRGEESVIATLQSIKFLKEKDITDLKTIAFLKDLLSEINFEHVR